MLAAVAALAIPLPAFADDAGVPDGGVELCTEPAGVGNVGYQSADDWDDDGVLDWDDNCPFAYDPEMYDVSEPGSVGRGRRRHRRRLRPRRGR
jgi:hypothetical protein